MTFTSSNVIPKQTSYLMLDDTVGRQSSAILRSTGSGMLTSASLGLLLHNSVQTFLFIPGRSAAGPMGLLSSALPLETTSNQIEASSLLCTASGPGLGYSISLGPRPIACFLPSLTPGTLTPPPLCSHPFQTSTSAQLSQHRGPGLCCLRHWMTSVGFKQLMVVLCWMQILFVSSRFSLTSQHT